MSKKDQLFLTELLPTTYECNVYRLNSRKKWTKYYLAYKNNTIYYFPTPNSNLSKSLTLTSECTFELITMKEHNLVIKISYSKNETYCIALEDADSVKTLMYHFNSIKGIQEEQKLEPLQGSITRRQRKQTISHIMQTVPSTRELKRSYSMSSVKTVTFNGRINLTELAKTIPWLKNDNYIYFDQFLSFIPTLNQIKEGEIINYKIRANQLSNEIEICISAQVQMLSKSMLDYFNSIEGNENGLQLYENTIKKMNQFDNIEFFIYITQKEGKESAEISIQILYFFQGLKECTVTSSPSVSTIFILLSNQPKLSIEIKSKRN